MASDAVPAGEGQTLVTEAQASSPHTTRLAAHDIGEATAPADLAAVLDELARETRRRAVRKRLAAAVLASYVLAITVLIAAGMGHVTGWFSGALSASFVIAAVGGRLRRAARRLATFDDPRAAGPLIEALAYGDGVRAIAVQRLTGLLPRVSMTAIAAWPDAQRAALRRALRASDPRREGEFVVALLEVVERAGEVRALQAVRELCTLKAADARVAPVRERARSVLQSLERAQASHRAATTLLRPAEVAEVEPNLLRPASCADCAGEGTLLRPGGEAVADQGGAT